MDNKYIFGVLVSVILVGTYALVINPSQDLGKEEPESIDDDISLKDESNVSLNCILPDVSGERATLAEIVGKNITTRNDALNHSRTIFPEYYDINLSGPNNLGRFEAKVETCNNSWIRIYNSGCIVFTRDLPQKMVDPLNLSVEMAINISEKYISNHGGMNGGLLENISAGRVTSPNATINGKITAYTLIYRFNYNETKILGGDRICIVVNGDGEVIYYYMMKKHVVCTKNNASIITSTNAFESFSNYTRKFKLGNEISIGNVELGFYSPNQDSFKTSMPLVWCFRSVKGSCFYIDAISGKLVPS